MLDVLARLKEGLAGQYLLEREIGSGGMAYVFLARDIKHERLVAIKVLKPELSSLVSARRFLREIRLTAALQHPHILPLFDSGETDGLLYSVTPYVAGETLRQRLDRDRQLPLDEALAIASTIASALQYAHQRGIIHRDIKPENILVNGGDVLVADFGVALAIGELGGDRITSTGLAVGTPLYMSPEQASGERTLNAQSDIYSLGAVAYEMLVGEAPVTGPSTKAIVARLLTESPRPIRTVRDTVPTAVEAAIMKALAKTPADRFSSAAEFGAALRGETSVRGVRRATEWTLRRATPTAVSGLTLVALAAAALIFQNTRSSSPGDRSVARKLTFTGNAIYPALSPDGRFLAYAAQARDSQRVLVQDLAGGPPDTVAAFGEFGGAGSMEWSPDAARLLLTSSRGAAILSRRGAQVRTLRGAVEGTPQFAYWLPDGLSVSIHAESEKRILIVNLETGDTVPVAVRGDYRWIDEGSWSPDGKYFAVVTTAADVQHSQIRTVALDGQTEVVIEDTVQINSPRWSPDGAALYYAKGTSSIMRLPVSRRTGRRAGAPREVQSGLEALPFTAGLVRFSTSRDGLKLVYARGEQYSNIVRVDPRGALDAPEMLQLTTGTALRFSPTVSPDGRWIAFAAEGNGTSELYRMPTGGGTIEPITSGARVWPRSQIAWSPDGTRIAFESVRAGVGQVWTATVNNGELRRFERTNMNFITGHLTWAPGEHIAYQRPGTAIALLNPNTGSEALLSSDTAGVYHFPRYSSDGERMVMVRHRPPGYAGVSIFRVRDAAETRLPGGLLFPRGWSDDGRYFYAQDPTAPKLFRVGTDGNGTRTLLFAAPVREMECTAAGRLYPKSFICAVLDFVSDVWMINNFDPR